MQYRFRTMIERPDYTPPCAIALDVTYAAEQPYIEYDEEETSSGGVSAIAWTVVRLWHSTGQTYNTSALNETTNRLLVEPEFYDEIRDRCLEDFAQREIE